MAWGRVGIEEHRYYEKSGIYLHVFVAGADVTNRCFLFDDRPPLPRAYLYRVNEQGRKFVDPSTGEIAKEVVSDFEVREGAPFS